MHGLSVFLQGNGSSVHAKTIKNIGIDYDIAGNIKGLLIIILLMAERMSQSGVEHLMHQHKFQFAVAEVIHKFRVESDPVSVRIGSLTGQVDGEFHIH